MTAIEIGQSTAARPRPASPGSMASAISVASFGPTAVGWIKIMTGSFSSGLYLLAGMAVVSAVSTFWLDIKNPVAERELASVPAESVARQAGHSGGSVPSGTLCRAQRGGVSLMLAA